MRRDRDEKRKNSIINLKILSIVLVAIMASVLVCGGVLISYSIHLLKEREVQKNSEEIMEISESISRYIRDIEDFSGNLAMSDSMQLMLKRKDLLSGVDYYRNLRDIRKILKYYVALRSTAVNDMYIIDGQDAVIGDITKAYDVADEWYQKFLEKQHPNGFSVSEDEENGKQLYFVLSIQDMNNFQDKLGTLVLILNYDEFLRTTICREAYGNQMILLDQRGNVLASTAGEKGQEETFKTDCLEYAGESGEICQQSGAYYFHQTVASQQWELYGTLKKNEITKTLQPAFKVFGLVVILCIAFAVLVFLPLIHRITRPLDEIIHAMRQVSAGNLDTRLNINTKDELKMTADTFNQMLADIRKYMDEAVGREKRENELRMKLFMAQINPHFICNTLNAIIYQAQKIKAYEIVKVTRAFINIIQITINLDTASIATIRDEMKYIEDYMLITRFRYQDIADLEWDVEAGLENCKINRMVLYPMVENSILHGIFPKGEKGTIKISVARSEDCVRIQVSDDGVGMDEQRLHMIRERICQEELEDRRSIGLNNVNRRLVMLYGERFRMKIDSRAGEGCSITFEIPYRL